MAQDSELRADLLARIEARRTAVQAFLRDNRPRIRRRATITAVLSALAAVFTAGPAVGGQTFADSVQQRLGLSSDSVVWRVLCLAALVVSLGAAVLATIDKSQDAVSRLSTAEAANTELEGLAALLQFGTLPVEEAVKLYQQYAVKISFVEELPLPARGPEYGRQP
jgi:MFS family permease